MHGQCQQGSDDSLIQLILESDSRCRSAARPLDIGKPRDQGRESPTGVLLNVKAAQVDLLLVVPDVRLPALGAPAMQCEPTSAGMQCACAILLLQPQSRKAGQGAERRLRK